MKMWEEDGLRMSYSAKRATEVLGVTTLEAHKSTP